MPAVSDPVAALFSNPERVGRTDAVVVLRDGDVVVERYGEGIGPDDTLRSWSMAKSMLHAAFGLLVDRDEVDLDAPASVAAWADPDDPRHAITPRQLLTMRAGLTWTEEPVGRTLPDVVHLVYGNDGRPQPDTAAWAADRPLSHAPGAHFQYASACSAILAGILRDTVGAGADGAAWLRTNLFDPVGMDSATPRFDEAGTWLASSFCFCTARDFARFGQLYLDEGACADGRRLLDPAWIATAAVETGRDALGRIHTMHWWRFGDDPWGAYGASGYLGQHIVVVPPLRLVVVRLGETPTEQRHHVHAALTDLIASFDE